MVRIVEFEQQLEEIEEVDELFVVEISSSLAN